MKYRTLAVVVASLFTAGSWASEMSKHNIVENPRFDDHGKDWRYWVANVKQDNAYKGKFRARIAKGSDHHVSQIITVPKSGYYTLKAHTIAPDAGARMGLRNLGGEVLRQVPIRPSKDYRESKFKRIALEKGEVLEIFFSGSDKGAVSIDSVSLKRDKKLPIPVFNQVIEFAVSNQIGETEINSINRTVRLSVPYATEVTDLEITKQRISRSSDSTLKEGDKVDFTQPVVMTLTDDLGVTEDWTVTVQVNPKELAVTSSNQELEASFKWAMAKTKQFVMTGRNGLVNRDEYHNDGSGRADYLPSYWAGYFDRTAFYSRDFLHQAVGAKLAGLEDENFSMFKIFAEHSTEARKWYTLWAVNFDGSPHTIDYKDDDYFVREVPAQFEFVEKAYQQYLWTGDKRYIDDPSLWQFYTKVLTDYIELHDDQSPNGIAEGYGGIFEGSATYNERGEFPIEAGDGIGSQYQATVAYAAMLEAKGLLGQASQWQEKAQQLKDYFNQDWSVIDPSQPLENYVNIVQKDGVKLNDFGKENSWFMPMKKITEPGARNDKYLDFISDKLGEGIGTNPDAPNNLEAYTYLPETFFPYHRNEEAWKWMQYIIDRKDVAHERPTQGTNGDYPEISYTFVSNTVEGLMGISPNANEHYVTTESHLPKEVDWLDVDYLLMGEHELKVKHVGQSESTLTNRANHPLQWQAQFYGEHKQLMVDGKLTPAQQHRVNGVALSYVVVELGPNETSSVSLVTYH